MVKDCLKNLKMAFIGLAGYLFIRSLAFTIKKEWVRRDYVQNLLEKKGQRVIYCFWHDRLLLMPFIALGQKAIVLTSQHTDGEYISRILSWFGFRSIRGSSTRGGSLALRRMVKEMRSGWNAAITPDGPKGPRHKVKDGAILLASMSGAPLVPVAFSSSKKKHFQAGIDF